LHSYCNYKGGTLQNGEAAFILYQVLKALAYLHQQNIVHRDVKLDNVLLTAYKHGARAILSDFGAAIDLSQDSTPFKARMFSVTGTYTYMAPFVCQWLLIFANHLVERY
jgi:serine/threonine protein kinase